MEAQQKYLSKFLKNQLKINRKKQKIHLWACSTNRTYLNLKDKKKNLLLQMLLTSGLERLLVLHRSG
nr:MAG TPA: hypothetical protein [Caudoviricetes sp.]